MNFFFLLCVFFSFPSHPFPFLAHSFFLSAMHLWCLRVRRLRSTPGGAAQGKGSENPVLALGRGERRRKRRRQEGGRRQGRGQLEQQQWPGGRSAVNVDGAPTAAVYKQKATAKATERVLCQVARHVLLALLLDL